MYFFSALLFRETHRFFQQRKKQGQQEQQPDSNHQRLSPYGGSIINGRAKKQYRQTCRGTEAAEYLCRVFQLIKYVLYKGKYII